MPDHLLHFILKMPASLVYLIYNLLLPLLLIFGLPGYIVKGIKRGNLRRNFAQRFGRLPESIQKLETQPFWIHAVSVGEVLVAAKIIKALREQAPQTPLVLTTTTTTGYNVAEKELGHDAGITVIHNPVDLPIVVRSVVKQINPAKLILVESEVWPNLVNYLTRLGVPVLLANARMSPRSESRYLKFRSLIAPVFGKLDRIAVPFDSDVTRWSGLGIDKQSITVTGSVKFDESVSEQSPAKIATLKSWLQENQCPEGPVFLAGSTHAGEELVCTQAWQKLREEHPTLQLVIIPRHAERASDFESELIDVGVKPVFRAYQSSVTTDTDTKDQIYISDTTGELRAWFHLADVVFIGKSLTGKGCQNPVEPILCGKPVIVGPNTQNFLEVVRDLLDKQGITQVQNAAELEQVIGEFLNDPESGEAQSARGKAALQQHHGSSIRTAEWILSE